MSRVGRNDPCPCGSGKKYKRCCLLASAAEPRRHPAHQLDEELVAEILAFARRRLGQAWLDEAEDVYAEDIPASPEEKPLMLQWWIYHHVLHDGEALLIDRFLEEKGARLDERRRRWIEAQKAAWVSLWEVRTVQPELGTLQLRDLLSGEERTVRDVSMSTSARPLSVSLFRVVDFDDTALLCGAHPMMLRPLQAQEVIARYRDYLEAPSGRVPASTLRAPENAEQLLSLWREAVDAAMHPAPPRLSNSDGDPIEWTEDTFAFDPGVRNELLQRLGSLGDLRELDAETEVSFVREGSKLSPALGNTSLGRAVVGGNRLRIESNSTNRGNALRQQVEKAAGDLIRFEGRSQKPLEAMLREPREETPREDLMEHPAAQEAVRQFKLRHYQQWLDSPIPALAGMTPREAVHDDVQRSRLQALIKDVEQQESRQDHRGRIDVGFLWEELQLER